MGRNIKNLNTSGLFFKIDYKPLLLVRVLNLESHNPMFWFFLFVCQFDLPAQDELGY